MRGFIKCPIQYLSRKDSLQDKRECVEIAGPDFGLWKLSIIESFNWLLTKLWIIHDWSTNEMEEKEYMKNAELRMEKNL